MEMKKVDDVNGENINRHHVATLPVKMEDGGKSRNGVLISVPDYEGLETFLGLEIGLWILGSVWTTYRYL